MTDTEMTPEVEDLGEELSDEALDRTGTEFLSGGPVTGLIPLCNGNNCAAG